MEWLTKALEALKLPLKYIWVIAIASGLLLFVPSRYLDKINLTTICKDYGPIIGAIFLVSSILVGVHIVVSLWNYGRNRYLRSKREKYRKQALHSLDPKEKAVLREFYIQAQSTLQLPIDQPIVAGLLAKGILGRVGQHGERSLAGVLWPVVIHEDAEQELTLDMIELPEPNPPADKIQWLRDNRPDFMPEIEHHNEVFHTSWTRRRIDF